MLIGGNGSGKSSVLQALSLVNEFGHGNASRFFEDRGWNSSDVRCRITGSRAFRADILLSDELDHDFLWQITWSLTTGINVREVVWRCRVNQRSPTRIFDYNRNTRSLRLGKTRTEASYRIPGSALAFIDLDSQDENQERLREISDWSRSITSLELLSPNAMRGGTRGATNNIGMRGERLASFLANLSAGSKSKLVKRLKRYYPISNIETTKKRAGWVDMRIAEAFARVGSISPAHTSDGLLRLIALCAIPEFAEDNRLVMLDEIEDGVEPHILPELIQDIVSESESQFVFTSHSPLLANFFHPIDIHVLTRLSDGSVTTMQLSEFEDWEEGLEYFGPGEMWSMAERKSINRQLIANARSKTRREKKTQINRFSSRWVESFLLERKGLDG